MANADSRFGLKPVGRNGTPWAGQLNPYYIPSTYATDLFVGDPVVKTGTANTASITVPGAGFFDIATLPEINKATAGDGNPITGVICGFAAIPGSLQYIYNPASTERVALVCDDRDALYEIQADGAIAATSIGLNAVLIYTHSGSTVTGLSGVELDTTSDVPAADASNQVTIQRMVNRVDNTPNLIWNKVIVRINQHTEGDNVIGI